MALQTTGDGRAPVCRPGPAAASVLVLGRARDRRRPAAFVAPRLPGRAHAAAPRTRLLLGLRPAGAYGHAGRERRRSTAAHAGVLAALREAVPDPSHAPGRRVRRQRRALAGGG